MEYKLKNMLPPEDEVVRLWCINKNDGHRAWGNYKLKKTGVEFCWCNSSGSVAPEVNNGEWKPESWER